MKRITSILLVSMLVIPSLIIADPGGRGGCDKSGGKKGFGQKGQKMQQMKLYGPGVKQVLRNADAIELTDAQTDKLENLATTFQMERVDREADLKKAKISLNALLRGNASEAEVTRAIDEVSRNEADIKKMRYRHHGEVKTILTEKQLDSLKDTMKNRRFAGKDGEERTRKMKNGTGRRR